MRKWPVLLLALAMGVGYAWAAPSTQQKVGDGDTSAQTTERDQPGTPAAPLVVNERSIRSGEEAAEEARKEAEQERFDSWTIRLTFAIAVCAGLQFLAIVGQIIVYRGQSKLMANTLGEIHAQAEQMKVQTTTAQIGVGTGLEQLRAMQIQTDEITRQVNLMESQTRILGDSVEVARISAVAAQKSAGAAEQSARTFINRERARLFIRPNISGNFNAVFHVENLGSSPALVYYGFVGCEIIRKDEDLPLPPDYTNGDPEWVFGRADWVTNNESVRVGEYSADYVDKTGNPELYEDVMAGRDVVWFYGIVRYEDIVSGKGEEIRFCYRCHAFPDGKSFLSEAGPAEYRDRHPYDKPN